MSPDLLQFRWARKWTFVPRHPPAPAWPPPARQDLWNRKTNLSPRVVFDRAYHVVCAGDAVIFGSSSDDRVTCLDAETGEPRWTYFAEAPVRLAPTIVKEPRAVWLRRRSSPLCPSRTWALLWRFNAFHDDRRLPGNGRMISHRPIRTGVVVEEDIAWFCAGLFPNQGVEQFAVSLQDGRLLAREVVAASPQGYLELMGGACSFLTGRDPAGAFSSTLLRRGKTTGKEASELAQQFRHAFIGAGDVRIGGGEGIVQAMSAEDGNILWKETIEGTVWALATARGKLFVSSDSGRIDCYATPHADQKFGTVIKEQTEMFPRGTIPTWMLPAWPAGSRSRRVPAAGAWLPPPIPTGSPNWHGNRNGGSWVSPRTKSRPIRRGSDWQPGDYTGSGSPSMF
ncbi:MAG: PQQ-binding-like beta-propeller repeat protein [Planctomycetaceae bacterium]